MSPTLSQIHVYPVKSCRGVPVETAVVTPTGLAFDREFQVVDADGNPVTQRQVAALATVQPTLIDGGLRLEAESRAALEIERPADNDVDVHCLLGTTVAAADCGAAAAAWFTDLLGRPSRLVAMTPSSDRMVPGLEVRSSWADAAPVLVANAASLDWLVQRSSEPFGMDRFRANLTVTGADAWQEDTWRAFRIGEAELGRSLPWPRCAIPQVDQQSGERHQEPAKVLRAHRWCDAGSLDDAFLASFLEGNALFGLACSIGVVGAEVAIGDELTVAERAEPLLAPPA